MVVTTRRWTPIIESTKPGLSGPRLEYFNCKKRIVVVAAGRRSLKTELAKRKLVTSLLEPLINPKTYDDFRVFFAAPTEGQAKKIAWNDLVKLTPPSWVSSINKSDMCITAKWGAELWVLGLDAPKRIEGVGWNGGVIDERSDIPETAWIENIRPALSDRLGWSWHIGVPDYRGKSNNEFKQLFERGINGDPNVGSFTWPSIDVMSPEEIEQAKRDMTPLMFKQEYEASWENAPGRAYHEFSRNRHVKDTAVYRPNEPVCVSCDFNRGFHNWGLYQYDDGKYIAFDEVFLENATVEMMLVLLTDKLNKLEALREVHFYGDQSGKSSTAFATEDGWTQIRNGMNAWTREQNRRSQPKYLYQAQGAIHDRIDAVNIQLCNAAGEIRTEINPKCYNLIRDLEEVSVKLLYSRSKTDILSHASDNFGYFVVQHERKTSKATLTRISQNF